MAKNAIQPRKTAPFCTDRVRADETPTQVQETLGVSPDSMVAVTYTVIGSTVHDTVSPLLDALDRTQAAARRSGMTEKDLADILRS